MNPAQSYRPIPVSAARQISEDYAKSIVILVTWDSTHDRTDIITYGVEPAQKRVAARTGVRVAKALHLESTPSRTLEDFRYRTQAEWAAERDQLIKRIQELEAKP